MATRKYYYFKNASGRRYVEVTTFPVNTSINPSFEELTEEQAEFYMEHPEASISEITKCRLNPTPEPYVQTLAELKEEKLHDLCVMSLETVGLFCSSYQFANAQSSLYAIENGLTPFYDEATSRHYIEEYLRVGILCRNMYYETKALIEGAASKFDVNAAFDDAMEYYNSIN